MWRVVAASITFENSTFGTFREDGFNPRRTYLKGQANPGQIVLKMESKNPPKKTQKSVSKSSPIQESLMPAVLKCPLAPLDKWPAEPLFWAEATRSFEVQAACWMKVKEQIKLRKSLLEDEQQGN